MICSKTQIIATIGPASESKEMMRQMFMHQMDVIRFNFSWSDMDERLLQIKHIRELEQELGRGIPIIQDLPGPRIQNSNDHTYDPSVGALTDRDKEFIKFGVDNDMDYIALSFVGSASDVLQCRSVINDCGGSQKIIAKIERQKALDNFEEILAVSDAIMIARGDLGLEVPIEKIPFIQASLIKKTKRSGKPVITATQMLTSMVRSPAPTRAEVTDVSNAVMQGSDALMLSEETSIGKYPLEAVTIMERVIAEAERHLDGELCANVLIKL